MYIFHVFYWVGMSKISHQLEFWSRFVKMLWKNDRMKHVYCFLCFPALKTHSGDPFDTLPKNFWYEFSSPFTESYDDLTEPEPKTTPDPLPFFEDHANSTNVTTQLGSSVYLHCKVNDLRDKTVSLFLSWDNDFKCVCLCVSYVAVHIA
jgi:hypothetical protein